MINLRNLHLENFMNIDSLDISFDDNTIISISGRNGNGKSSLIYAIALCITGYRYGDSFKNQIKRGAEEAKIILEAELKGYPILYDITIKNKASNVLTRKVTYKDITYNNSDYDNFIKENDLNYIEGLMFLFQNEDNLINSKPSERANILRKLFQFEFPDIVSDFKLRQENNKTSNIELTASINELNSRTFSLSPLIRGYSEEQVSKFKEDVDRIDEKLSLTCDEKNLNKEIQSLESVYKSHKDFYDELKRKLKVINPVDPPSLTNVEEVKDKKDKIQEILIDKRAQLSVKENNIKTLSSQIEIAKTGICHACGQPVDKNHYLSLQGEYERISTELEGIREEVASLSKEFNSLSSQLTNYEFETNRYNKYLADKEYNSSVLENMKTRQLLIDKTVEQLNSLYEKRRTVSGVDRSKLAEEKESLLNKIEKAKEIEITNRERIKSNNTLKEEEKERDKKVEEYNLRLNDNLRDTTVVKQCIDVFENSFPNYILLRTCSKLEDYINAIIGNVFEGFRVRLNQSRGGVNFYYKTSRIGEEDEWMPVCMASGAEKKILSLAYTIALGKMYGLSCILLDEVDGSCDTDSAMDIYRFITSLRDFNQIIFISHNKAVRDVVKESDKDIIYYEVVNGEYNLLEER